MAFQERDFYKVDTNSTAQNNEVKSIIHHKIKPLFEEEQDEEELKKSKMKDFFLKKNFYKKVQALRSEPESGESAPYQ